MDDFRVALRPESERLVVAVHGELDDASGEKLRRVVADLLREGRVQGELALDLSAISFMDSRGLGQLLAACQAAERAGRRVQVVDPSVHVQRVLDSAGVSDLLRGD